MSRRTLWEAKRPCRRRSCPTWTASRRPASWGLPTTCLCGLTPASDVATLSLFGYDPLQVYTGRAPLETAAMGLKLGAGDWAIRCNLVHVDNEEMRDFTAGHISPGDGTALMKSIQRATRWPGSHGIRAQRALGVSCRCELSQYPHLSRRRRPPSLKTPRRNHRTMCLTAPLPIICPRARAATCFAT